MNENNAENKVGDTVKDESIKLVATNWTLYREDTFEEGAIHFELDDEGGGHFIKVSQCLDTGEQTITMDSDEVDRFVEALLMIKDRCIEINEM